MKGMVLGVDVAQFAKDYTVFAVMRGDRLVYAESGRGLSVTEMVERTKRLNRYWNCEGRIKVGDVSVGGGLKDKLIELGICSG